MRFDINAFIKRFSVFLVFLIAVSFFTPSVDALQKPEHGNIKSGIIVDMDSGRVLYEHNADAVMNPASTTKVMTALLVFEAIARGEITLDDRVSTTQTIIDGVMWDASKISPPLVDGEAMSVRDYLRCVLMVSDCVACDVLAVHTSGSVDAFVAQMNKRAAELSCTDTNFVNAHGYPADNHYSTARDLYRITAEALKYPEFCEIFGTIKHSLGSTNKNNARMLYNTDWMLWNPEKITSIYTEYYYPYTLGGKTGTSEASGHCLTSYAEKDGVRLLCVVLGADMEKQADGSFDKMSFRVSEQLYKWAYDNWSVQTVLSSSDILGVQPIEKGKAESVELYLTENVSELLPNGTTRDQLVIETLLNEEIVKAPVAAYTQLGVANIYFENELIATVPLASLSAVEKKGLSGMGVVLLIMGLLLILAAGGWFYYNKKVASQRQIAAYSAKRNGAERAARYNIGYYGDNLSPEDYTGYRSRQPSDGEYRRQRSDESTQMSRQYYNTYNDYDPYGDDEIE